MKENPVMIVTGASRGVGAAVACWLGKAAATVVLTARSEAALKRVDSRVTGLGGTAHLFPADVADPDQCAACVAETVKRFGALDGLVNNAGILDPLSTVAEADPARWRRNLEVNVLGPFYLMKEAIPYLRKQHGRIVSVSSGAAYHPIYGGSAYCASKAALNQLNSVLAKEEPDVTCVAVRPGVVDTLMQEKIRREGPAVMPSDEAGYYLSLKEKNTLEPPEIPGRSIAWLALAAPKVFSGRFVSYDDNEILLPAKKLLGETFE